MKIIQVYALTPFYDDKKMEIFYEDVEGEIAQNSVFFHNR